MTPSHPYPPIGDYALISDCHSVALVSSTGSIDWCCMPRADSASSFGRLLDWHTAGHCSIEPLGDAQPVARAYVEDTMVLRTTFRGPTGAADVVDCFTMREGGRDAPYQELARVVEGLEGHVQLRLWVVPRFDYGALRPWLRLVHPNAVAAIGGADGLVISCDAPLVAAGHHELHSTFTVRAGERVRLTLRYRRPELIDAADIHLIDPAQVDKRVHATVNWWKKWGSQARLDGDTRANGLRSALVLKALTNAPTGAVAAAATTSLPESPGGDRNWDYRFSWVRDSVFTLRALGDCGFDREADGFRRFIQRSSAGSAHELQIMYGLGGERRLTEIELPHLEGYRGSHPVRIGNAASEQLQLDSLGELLELAWRWHLRGETPDADYWRFLRDLVEVACERWTEPDRGIWEMRGDPRHFVHSKVMCWTAVDRGIALAEAAGLSAPVSHWKEVAAEIRAAIESRGFDKARGTFTQSFDDAALDSALLLIPESGFVDHHDPRMIATVDAIRAELEENGLLLRYRPDQVDDGVSRGREGQFLACTFWLVEVLAKQGRLQAAEEVFERVTATANDLGLFAEEYDPVSGQLLGNFPQGLSHLSHLTAIVALSAARARAD